ncbi:hypothetical protein HPP92_019464 [Vanilla planifolia]|uniref:BHLH domain-containing protein n=1 Tax=Vanilla planifolia TaxID=51239 RepID=A0A835PBE3_VANPL|nr:hypothetical protein HPP92_027374 [Vanilla planifolia]KAG0465300.1 hypothetical protein HPP92_019464 [Vanilla planifolia]
MRDMGMVGAVTQIKFLKDLKVKDMVINVPENLNLIEGVKSLKPSLSTMELDFAGISGSLIENASFKYMELPNNTHLAHQPEFNIPFVDVFSSLFPVEFSKLVSIPEAGKKRKAIAVATTGTSLQKEDNTKRRKESLGEKSGSSNGMEKQKEVVHVRARRGQATDSHSLAERVRREKINEKIRCLKGLVPGCYKTMGMATMLDEIITYVQSLQHQVEFLSMKLSAATSLYDFNLDVEDKITTHQIGQVNNEPENDVKTSTRDQGYWGYTCFN